MIEDDVVERELRLGGTRAVGTEETGIIGQIRLRRSDARRTRSEGIVGQIM